MEFELSELCEQVMTARAAERPLYIRGGGTRRFYGEPEPDNLSGAAVLDISGHQGIVNYQPSELVVTAKAGTRLEALEAALRAQGQMLAFEPPRFGAASTVGGMVASGLSGPRRMAAGSLRDFVLGARLLDSSGVVLGFGGEVMKNVAGFDISRLLAGSMGIFGALIEVSLKVAPLPGVEAISVLDVDEAGALALFSQWRSKPLPISATAWFPEQGGRLYVRLSGSEPAVASGLRQIGGSAFEAAAGEALWASLRDQTHAFFDVPVLWRLSVPPQAGPLDLGPSLIEWNGGLRWVAGGPSVDAQSATALRARVEAAGGHATLYRYGASPGDVPVFHPLQPTLRNISQRMKQELDPVGIFNPGRLFREF
ncbi:glycolate oxidase subunit GlcE [Pusillimonas sp. TS35]|nr:glycolate oxidase subunit GlcE [Pusillimonas sp. TS35]